MHGLALAFIGLALAGDPIELPRDVEVIQTEQFAMPLLFDAARQAKIKRIRLFVSEDQGKTWQHQQDYQPTDTQATFTAPRDGLYWFTLQVVLKDGAKEPGTERDLAPSMKVYVNTERRAFKVQKSYAELQREVEELRKTVEQQQKRIKELESDRKRN